MPSGCSRAWRRQGGLRGVHPVVGTRARRHSSQWWPGSPHTLPIISALALDPGHPLRVSDVPTRGQWNSIGGGVSQRAAAHSPKVPWAPDTELGLLVQVPESAWEGWRCHLLSLPGGPVIPLGLQDPPRGLPALMSLSWGSVLPSLLTLDAFCVLECLVSFSQ